MGSLSIEVGIFGGLAGGVAIGAIGIHLGIVGIAVGNEGVGFVELVVSLAVLTFLVSVLGIDSLCLSVFDSRLGVGIVGFSSHLTGFFEVVVDILQSFLEFGEIHAFGVASGFLVGSFSLGVVVTEAIVAEGLVAVRGAVVIVSNEGGFLTIVTGILVGVAVPTEVDTHFQTEVEQVSLVHLIGVEDTVVGIDHRRTHGAVGGVDHRFVGLVDEVGEAIATIDAEVETPVAGEGIVETEVGNDADAELLQLDITALVSLVGIETLGRQIGVGDAGGGEVTRNLIVAFVGGVATLHGEVKLGTETDEEMPAVGQSRAPVELDGHAQHRHTLAFFPVVEAHSGIVGQTVGGVGQTVGDLLVVELGSAVDLVELETETETEMLTEEVDVLHFGKESQLGRPVAIGGFVAQRVHAASEVETDIIAVLVHLCMCCHRE